MWVGGQGFEGGGGEVGVLFVGVRERDGSEGMVRDVAIGRGRRRGGRRAVSMEACMAGRGVDEAVLAMVEF